MSKGVVNVEGNEHIRTCDDSIQDVLAPQPAVSLAQHD
jgi:hypothetical protein